MQSFRITSVSSLARQGATAAPFSFNIHVLELTTTLNIAPGYCRACAMSLKSSISLQSESAKKKRALTTRLLSVHATLDELIANLAFSTNVFEPLHNTTAQDLNSHCPTACLDARLRPSYHRTSTIIRAAPVGRDWETGQRNAFADTSPSTVCADTSEFDLATLVETTDNFDYVTRLSTEKLKEHSIQSFEALILAVVVQSGKPLVIEDWGENLPLWPFSKEWLESNSGNKRKLLPSG